MATRFWFPAVASNTSGLTPAFDSWNTTSEAARCDLVATKGSSAITAGTQVGPWTATAGQNALDRQFISAPLAAQTISGTFSLMLMTREFATTDNVDRIITGLYVVNGSGTKVATLKTLGNSGTTLEFVSNATHRTHTGANAAALTSYACAAGDRIVAEIGYSNSTGATTPEASAKWGENATDATLGDNATTADRAGWLEFSGTLTFQSTPVDAGSMTTTATSSTTSAFLLGLIMTAMTAIASSVTSLLTLLGILTGAQSSQSVATTSTSSTVEEAATPVDTGAMTSAGTSTTTTSALVGIVAGSMTASSTSSVTMTAQVGIPTGTMATSGASSTSTESTVEEYSGDGSAIANGGRAMGLGLGL